MQEFPTYLNAHQKLFCHWFALTGDARLAAERSFRSPARREGALTLLEAPVAKSYLAAVEDAMGHGHPLTAAEDGYRKLAFGPVTDAVKLMFPAEGEPPDPARMDLYNIAKISQAMGWLPVKGKRPPRRMPSVFWRLWPPGPPPMRRTDNAAFPVQ